MNMVQTIENIKKELINRNLNTTLKHCKEVVFLIDKKKKESQQMVKFIPSWNLYLMMSVRLS